MVEERDGSARRRGTAAQGKSAGVIGSRVPGSKVQGFESSKVPGSEVPRSKVPRSKVQGFAYTVRSRGGFRPRQVRLHRSRYLTRLTDVPVARLASTVNSMC